MTPPQNSGATPLVLASGPGTGWLAIAGMLTDLAFETDALGRFTAFAPGKALGQPAAQLLGTEMASLLTGPPGEESLSAAQFRSIIATICMECVAWHGRVQLTRPDGRTSTFRLSLAPRMAGGSVSGTYGLLFDLEAPELSLPDSHAGRTGDPALRLSTMLDAETGLWSHRTFAEEMSRRFDRLDVEGQPGTLLYLGFLGAPAPLHGAIAMRMAEELRDIIRPTDLLGRIDATTIALWCDNMDHLTGGERAAKFCTQLPPLLPGNTPVTVGVAPRWAGSGEDTATVTAHAIAALRLADIVAQRATGAPASGAWKVWQRD